MILYLERYGQLYQRQGGKCMVLERPLLVWGLVQTEQSAELHSSACAFDSTALNIRWGITKNKHAQALMMVMAVD
ncbi:unnamed protein product [Ixodes persulcatus]